MPGMPEDQSAYRSELFGLWGILQSLHKLTQDYNIKSGSVVIACESLSVLKKQNVCTPLNQAKPIKNNSLLIVLSLSLGLN